jgi:nucleoside-diphosphate-sugar epimerase
MCEISFRGDLSPRAGNPGGFLCRGFLLRSAQLQPRVLRMKILFVGGTGNISTECAALLHERGHDILVLSRGRQAVPAPYRAIQADRKDATAMRTVLKGSDVDVVINFLGYDLPDVETDYSLFGGAIRHYFFISTTSVYARPAPRLPLTEQTPLGNRLWDYAQKKLACEQWLLERWRETGFPVTIVRPSHTYSRRWVPNPVSSASYSFAARLERGQPVFVPDAGENPWTLTAAADFAVGLAGLVGKPETVGESFHITSDETLTWNQIVAEIAAAVGASSPCVEKIPVEFICRIAPRLIGTLKSDKANPGVFDNSKIKRFVPEFKCRIPFRVGVRESVAWLRQHPEAQNLDPAVDATCDQVIAAWRANL